MQNVFISSLHTRCKPNAVLTSGIGRYIQKNDFNIVQDITKADYVIVNTCGFTAEQEEVCVNLFRSAKSKVKPGCKLISMGCLNKIAGHIFEESGLEDVHVLHEENEIDNLLSPKIKYDDVPGKFVDETVLERMGIGIYSTSSIYSDKIKNFFYSLENLRGTKSALGLLYKVVDQNNKVFIQVASGCVGNCAYCIIKKAKGHIKSRSLEDVLNDVTKLYQPDKSIYLVGDDCASYGADIKSSLPKLILDINSHFPNAVFNINYVSPFWLEKQESEYFEMFQKVNIASINVTVQSGSNYIIKKMNRSYDIKNIKRIIRRLRKISPRTVFLTHMLVGFPGERFSDFLKTLLTITHFDGSGIFAYSDRKGTASDKMNNKIALSTIKRREFIGNKVYQINVILRTLKDFIVGR